MSSDSSYRGPFASIEDEEEDEEEEDASSTMSDEEEDVMEFPEFSVEVSIDLDKQISS